MSYPQIETSQPTLHYCDLMQIFNYHLLILQKVCQQLGVPDEFVYYFALFLVQRDETTGKVSILRKLQDYESPYISQKSFVRKNASCKLVLRKR